MAAWASLVTRWPYNLTLTLKNYAFGDFDTNDGDGPNTLAVDSADNLFVAGSSYVTGSYNASVAKLDPTGTVLWKYRYKGAGSDAGASPVLEAHAIAFDASRVYVLGTNGIYQNTRTASFVLALQSATGTPDVNFNNGLVLDSSGNSASCSFTVTVNDTQAPAITCPANVTKATDPNLCSAVVTFTVTATDNCPGVTVVAAPPSGSSFPKGTTTVTATATDGSGNTATCSFTVTVNDTQAPTVVCPANIVAMPPAIGSPCANVSYPAPVVTDNCPGATVVCTPASGSCFPAGSTTVTCTATDASGNMASCSFTITTFDLCVQDDANPAAMVLVNTTTGDYQFCCGGNSYTGSGSVSIKGNLVTVEQNKTNRRVIIKVDKGLKQGTASYASPPGSILCQIRDTNITNNSCACH